MDQSRKVGSLMTSTKLCKVELLCEQHGKYQGWQQMIADKVVHSICPQCAKDDARRDQLTFAKARKAAGKQTLLEKFGHCGIPPRFQDRGFSNYNAETEGQQRALEITKNYALNFEDNCKAGRGLFFIGTTGTGKTHLANAICREVIRKGHSALFTQVIDAVQVIRESINDSTTSERQAIAQFAEPDLLVLDEVGVQHKTQYEFVVLTQLINKRYDFMRPTIIMSNHKLSELKEMLGVRIFDRLRELNDPVVFDWRSHRARAA